MERKTVRPREAIKGKMTNAYVGMDYYEVVIRVDGKGPHPSIQMGREVEIKVIMPEEENNGS